MNDDKNQPFVTIYGLSDPREPDKIRYIGVTCKTANYRLWQHCHKAKRHFPRGSKNKRDAWIYSLLESGLKPKVVILGTCESFEAEIIEQDFIRQFSATGLLTNNPKRSAYAWNRGEEFSKEQIETYLQQRKAKSKLAEHWSPELLARMFPNKLALAELERRMERTTQ